MKGKLNSQDYIGYRNWYFETDRDAGVISIHFPSGETEMWSCKKDYFHKIGAGDGDLPIHMRSQSTSLLNKFMQVLRHFYDAGMELYYEPTDARRKRIYARAFARAGINVKEFSSLTVIKKESH